MWRNIKQFILQENKFEKKDVIFDDTKYRDRIIITNNFNNFFVPIKTEKSVSIDA